jgi:plastocyanin
MSHFFKRSMIGCLIILLGIGAGVIIFQPTTAQEPQAHIAAQKTFTVTARQWSFDPSTITVDEGDAVTLNITSMDVTHGFSITEFGVNATLVPGQTTTVNFTASRAGSFSFFCSVSCGSGHSSMRGTLIVNAAPASNTNNNSNSNSNSNTNTNEEDEDEDEPSQTNSNNNTNTSTNTNTNTNKNSNANLSPADITAPVISGATVESVTETTATMKWTTNESATGKVNYGTKSGTYPFSSQGGIGTSHTAKLTGLSSGTTYFYQIWSQDSAGNTGTRSEQKFTTSSPSTGTTNTNTSTTANTNTETATNTATTNATPTNETREGEGETGADSPPTAAVNEAIPQAVPSPLESIRVGQNELPVPVLAEGRAMIAASNSSNAEGETSETGKLTFTAAETVTFSGKTYPLTTVTVTVSSDPVTKTTTSDAGGQWELRFNETLEEGGHVVAVEVVNPETKAVEKSEPVPFTIIPASAASAINEPQGALSQNAGPSDANRTMILWISLGVLVAILIIVLILIGSRWSKRSSGS